MYICIPLVWTRQGENAEVHGREDGPQHQAQQFARAVLGVGEQDDRRPGKEKGLG